VKVVISQGLILCKIGKLGKEIGEKPG